jgi:uncharacterized membrane protein
MPMWTRAELKQNAKGVLRNNYWECVVALLIYGAIALVASLIGPVIPFGSIAATLFLLLPLSVGLNYFFMQNQVAPARLQNVFFPFEGGRFLKITGAMAWMFLFIFLWSLIAVIGFFIALVKWISTLIPAMMLDNFTPGNFSPYSFDVYNYLFQHLHFDSSWIPVLIACGVIYLAGGILLTVKSLSYSMTGYILTDNPFIGYDRALKLSMAMTDGQKWRMFVLALSFIGWLLLALLTAGIGYLFLSPYIMATQAQLYVRLRDNAINNGLTTSQELNVFPK